MDFFCQNSFNNLLDALAVLTVGVTLSDACKVAFLVKLPCLPKHPWPEIKNFLKWFQGSALHSSKLSNSIFPYCCFRSYIHFPLIEFVRPFQFVTHIIYSPCTMHAFSSESSGHPLSTDHSHKTIGVSVLNKNQFLSDPYRSHQEKAMSRQRQQLGLRT